MSDLGLHCLPMSQKWDVRLIWVKSMGKIQVVLNSSQVKIKYKFAKPFLSKCFLKMETMQKVNNFSVNRKLFIIDFFQNFIIFTEGSCENVMNDHVLLNISPVTQKWFRKLILI